MVKSVTPIIWQTIAEGLTPADAADKFGSSCFERIYKVKSLLDIGKYDRVRFMLENKETIYEVSYASNLRPLWVVRIIQEVK